MEGERWGPVNTRRTVNESVRSSPASLRGNGGSCGPGWREPWRGLVARSPDFLRRDAQRQNDDITAAVARIVGRHQAVGGRMRRIVILVRGRLPNTDVPLLVSAEESPRQARQGKHQHHQPACYRTRYRHCQRSIPMPGGSINHNLHNPRPGSVGRIAEIRGALQGKDDHPLTTDRAGNSGDTLLNY